MGKIIILVGTGNNGGDGFVIARTLLNKKYDVHVIQVAPSGKLTKNTHFHKQLYLHLGGSVVLAEETVVELFIEQADMVIDAMIGIGVRGDLREPIAGIVDMINETARYIISVDIPSALPADEGISDFQAVQADYTIVIGAPKSNAFLQHTAPFYGQWEMVSIGFPQAAFEKYTNKQVMTAEDLHKSCQSVVNMTTKGVTGKD